MKSLLLVPRKSEIRDANCQLLAAYPIWANNAIILDMMSPWAGDGMRDSELKKKTKRRK